MKGTKTPNKVVVIVQDDQEYSGQTYLQGNMPTSLSSGRQQASGMEKKDMKKLKKSGFGSASMMPDVLKPEIRERMHDPDAFRNSSLEVLVRAYIEMARATEKYTAEKYFRALYDDIKGDLHNWRLFSSVENNQYAWVEKICSSLGNLATIYRRRGWYPLCEEVMSNYKEMLDRHDEMICRRMALGQANDDDIYNQRIMTNKYYLIAINLALNLKRPAGVPAIYRSLMQFEIDMGKARTDEDDFVWMIETFHGKPKTSAGLAATTDAQLLHCFNTFITNETPETLSMNFVSKEDFHKVYPGELWGGTVDLAVCDNCKSTEPFLSTYKACGRCKAVKYCGKDCQVAHYKVHKENCKKIAASK